MILTLCILDFENRENKKIQSCWSVSYRDIAFEINFNMKISKCNMCIGFDVKYWERFYRSLGTYNQGV